MAAILKNSVSLPSKPQYRVCVTRFLTWNGNRPINEETLREYFKYLGSFMSPASVRLAKTSIKLWILKTHSKRNDLNFRNGIQAFFREIKVSKPNITVSDSKLLSERELKLLIRKLPLKYSLILRVLYGTGSRVSEVLSIKIVNCKHLKTHIETKVIGKGGKEHVLIISKDLFERIGKVFGGKEFLFENSSTGKPYTRQLVHRNFNDVGLRELKRRVYPHQTRHSRISHLLRQGKPIDAVSRFANHFDPSFTAKVYGQNKLQAKEILDSCYI
ncbi:tyrosine-type recombinase/integrase [Leptospira mtsangambouensis]|uniref:tyrosine-type recombinase/integrase n=1 Tax=Leptospira mtsangambouensis TaxID=2484912 RepID=UPI001EEB609E|nr:site-specific integrase [Leptospira mtsangambouensis]MCG6140650.1 site-specific integrase [Leptospira mtsangambouensis]